MPRLRLLPLLSVALAYPQAYSEFFKDFPEARFLGGSTTFTFFQTAKGVLAKVRRLHYCHYDMTTI